METLMERETNEEYEKWRTEANMEWRRLENAGISLCNDRITKYGELRTAYLDDGEVEEDEAESLEMEERRTAIMGVIVRLEKENETLREEKIQMAEHHKMEIDELNDRITLMNLQKEELKEMMEAKSEREEEKIKGMEESEREVEKNENKNT